MLHRILMQQCTKTTTQAWYSNCSTGAAESHEIPVAGFCVLPSWGRVSSVPWEAGMAWSQLKSVTVFKVPVAGCSVWLLCVELSVHCSGCLRKVVLSLDCFREGHLPHSLTHSANTILYSKGCKDPLVSLASRWVQLSSQLMWTLPRFCCSQNSVRNCAYLLGASFCCRALLISLLFQVEKYYMKFWGFGFFSYQLCFQLKK